MVKRHHVEVVEIPTEQLAYVPGPHADRLATIARRSWTGSAAVLTRSGASRVAARAWSVRAVSGTVGNTGPTFRRLIDVPGARLGLVLGAWWQQGDHDDGHLRLDAPCAVDEVW